MHGGFRNDMRDAMSDKDFHGNTRVFGFGIRQVYNRTGDAVGDLVRMSRIYFFKHKKL